jgi:hypothetical protein
MDTEKILRKVLKHIPKSKWNLVSNILARISLPTIGSPVNFKTGRFYLKEFDTLSMDSVNFEKFLNFTYPIDELGDRREKEIEIDRQYWKYSVTFMAFDNKENVVGCVQFIRKEEGMKLPVEYGHVVNQTSLAHKLIPKGKLTEVYRCRKSDKLRGAESVLVLMMLIKAIWAKVIQTETDYSFISFDGKNKQLKNLYTNKLPFSDPQTSISFDGCPGQWSILYADWRRQEYNYARESIAHFMMSTFCRKNLATKNLKTEPEHTPYCDNLISEDDAILFATVHTSARSKTGSDSTLKSQSTQQYS